MRKKALLFLLSIFYVATAMAQQEDVVTGKIVDSQGLPLVGAVIALEGTQAAVTSDLDGLYTLQLSGAENPMLEITYVGMVTQRIAVGPSKVVNAKMEDDVVSLEAVVKIGYGTVKRKELTGATVNVKAESISKTMSADLGTALQGLVPGLSVTASTGEPGASSVVQIRGVTSISGSNTPLYVVDGIPQEGDPMISSNEIESIDILKDAASCAIYGTRGAAGVILVTTKQGASGKLNISAEATYAIQEINEGNLPNLMNTSKQAYFDILKGRLVGSYLGDDFINTEIDKRPIYYLNDTDIYGMLIDNYAPEQSYNLSLSGGSKNLTFSAVTGYYDQKGVLNNASYNRFNFRGNIAYKNDKMQLTLGTSYMLTEQSRANGTSISNAIRFLPYSPELDPNANSYEVPAGGNSTESTAMAALLRAMRATDRSDGNVASVNVGFDYNLVEGLQFTSKLGIRSQSILRIQRTPNITIYNSDGKVENDGFINSYIANSSTERQSFNFTGGFNYNKKWNAGHKISSIALFSYEQYNNYGFIASKEGLITSNYDALDFGTINPNAKSSPSYNDKLLGVIGRVMYDYKSRYMLSASLRCDASSKFSANNRWGLFPSLSAGWNINEEAFWQPLQDYVSIFKLRASYGTTGNQSFASYSYMPLMKQNYDYSFGNNGYENLENGIIRVAYSNSDLKWETSVQSNIGIDLGFLSNKLVFSADFYHTDKRDMLSAVQLPASVGGGTKQDAMIVKNIGDMVNQGLELNLSYKYSLNDFSLNANINYAMNKNTITHLGNSGAIIYNSSSAVTNGDPNSVVTAFVEGYEAGAFFLYQTDGVINDQAELDEYQMQGGSQRTFHPDAMIGDLKFKDVNGDKQFTNADRTYVGSALPDFEMGFNLNLKYKAFDLTSNWYASVGNEAVNGPLAQSYYAGRNENLIYSWSDSNPQSAIPAYRGDGKSHKNYISYSDLWLEDASFLRMQLLSMGYTLSKDNTRWIKGTNKARIFLSGQNLLTLTKYSGLDPEIGGDGVATRGVDKGNYPVSRKFIVGVKLTF